MGRSFLQSREITIIDMLGLHLEGVCTLRDKQHFFDIQITKVDPAHIPEWLKSWILPLPFSILPFISSCQQRHTFLVWWLKTNPFKSIGSLTLNLRGIGFGLDSFKTGIYHYLKPSLPRKWFRCSDVPVAALPDSRLWTPVLWILMHELSCLRYGTLLYLLIDLCSWASQY